MTGLLTPLVQPEPNFIQLMFDRQSEADLIMLKLQRAASGGSADYFVPAGLYTDIKNNIEMAFSNDHNLIIEANFYHQLPCRDQTELITELFDSF